MSKIRTSTWKNGLTWWDLFAGISNSKTVLIYITENLSIYANPCAWLCTLITIKSKLDGLIFRYDNTAHYMNIDTFPYHKHSGEGEVLAAQAPDLEKVLREIEPLINPDQMDS